jgi:nitrate/nitrite-specific signal transduction histidine kinase
MGDEGPGSGSSPVKPGHRGLSIIRERTSASGSDLTNTSQSGKGTEIVAVREERQ